MSNIVRITGIGLNHTVEVESDESLADIARSLGLDPSLQFRSGGETVDAEAPVTESLNVTATPPNVKLG